MKEIILQFPSLGSLIDFSILANCENCHLNLLHFTLRCCIGAEDLELAITQYGATVLNLEVI